MTMEELVIAIRVTAEGAQEDMEEVARSLALIGQTGAKSMEQLRQKTAETIRAVERMQKDAYRFAVSWIEQRRAIGTLTAQQEIEELERVRREYAVTAEQIIDIEKRIYEACRVLREGEESQITALHASIADALTARYKEARDAEKGSIDASIASWRAWSDETCAAIRRQIEAMDEQEKALQRDETQQEHMRGIDSLEQALAYEKDEYNRRQLEKQLERAKAAWEEVQRGWAKEDERASLDAQMEAAQQRAQAEIEALEAEKSRIDDVYAKLLNGQSIAAEAQKMLMESTQEDLLALLSSYAPDYEATGRTLGERVYEGFVQAFGDVSAWFEGFDAHFEAMTERAQTAAFQVSQGLVQQGQTHAAAGSPTINQTVNFNQPVESPADVARRMQQVSEELARRM